MNKSWEAVSAYDFNYINKLADFIKLQNTIHPVNFTKEEQKAFDELKKIKEDRGAFIRKFPNIQPIYQVR